MDKHHILLALTFLFAACGTAPVPRQIQDTIPINRPFDMVWEAVKEVVLDMDFSIDKGDKSLGFIQADRSLRSEEKDYCDCGHPGIMWGEDYRLGQLDIYIIKLSETSCEIRISSSFEQELMVGPGFANKTKACVSTGKLEAEIFRRVSEKIK